MRTRVLVPWSARVGGLVACLLAVAALLLTGPPRAVASKEGVIPFVGRVTGDDVNLRAGPGPEQRVIGTASDGLALRVLESTGDWYRVLPRDLWIPRSRIDSSGVVTGDVVPEMLGGPFPFSLRAGERLRIKAARPGYEGIEPAFCVDAPPGPSLWISRQYVRPAWRDPEPADFVPATSCPAKPQHLAALRVLKTENKLRFVAVPTHVPRGFASQPPQVQVEPKGSLRGFAPGYDLRFRGGKSWLQVSGTSGGLGGPPILKPFDVDTPLLGRVKVFTTQFAPDTLDIDWVALGGASPRLDAFGSPRDEDLRPLFISFACSSNLSVDEVKAILKSLRLVRL